MSRRRGLLLGVALALAAIVAIVGFFVFAGLQSTPADATLTIYSGAVQVERSGQTAFRPAKSGDSLHNGDSVQTAKPSRSAIVFGDGSVVRLDSCTDITLKNAQRQNGAYHTEIAQFSGKTWHRVQRLVGGSTYKVDGPNNSTAEARGTTFAVLTNLCGAQPGVKPTVSYDTFAGAIDVTAANKTVTVNTGFHTDVNAAGAPPSVPVRIPPSEAQDPWAISNESQDNNPAPTVRQLPPESGDIPPGTKIVGSATIQGDGQKDIDETLYWPGSCFTLTATFNGEDFQTISSCTPPTNIVLAKAQVGTWGYWLRNDQSAPQGDPWAVTLGYTSPSQNTPTPFFTDNNCAGTVTAGHSATLTTPKAKSSAGPPAISSSTLPSWATLADNKDGTGTFTFNPPANTAATTLSLTVTASIDGGSASTSCTEQVNALPHSSVISGHVRTRAGAGVSGVTLTLTAPDSTTSTALTDAGGAYSFSGLGAGAYNVQLGTPSGDAASGPTGQSKTVDGSNSVGNVDFVLIPPAAVSGISPASGPASGGTKVVITGSGFTPATGVSFGGSAATFTVNSDTQITATSPAHSPGTVDVQVVDAAGNSLTGSGDQFIYLISAPAVTGVNPSAGPIAGGSAVTITGAGFFSNGSSCNVTAVAFGSAAASLPPSICSDSTLQVVAPAAPGGTAATVDVRVTTPLGTSAVNAPADQFTYLPPPVVSSLSSSRGPTAGGATVTINGSNFLRTRSATSGCQVTAVMFGASNAAIASCTGTTVTVTTPSSAAGPVDVTVTSAGGTSPISSKDVYTYVAAPTVTAVSPSTLASGSTAQVTIGGTGFFGGLTTCNVSQVLFGSTAGTAVSCTSDTSLTVSAPGLSATGAIDVHVVTDGGSSPVNAPADQITFAAPLTVSASATTHTPDTGQSDAFLATPAGGSGPYTFSWAFGDSSTATTQNPSHSYTSAGSYTAAVTVNDSLGSTPATASLSVTATPPPSAASVTASKTAIDTGDNVSFSATVRNGTAPLSYSWNLGDGTTVVTGSTVAHTFVLTGAATATYSVVLAITDANGYGITASPVGITVNPALVAGASASPTQGSVPLVSNFVGSETGGTAPFTYSWAFGDGNSSTAQSPSYTYNSTGYPVATVTVTDAAMHSASATISFQIGTAICSANATSLDVPAGSTQTIGAGLYFIGSGCYNGITVEGTLTLDASKGTVEIRSQSGAGINVCTAVTSGCTGVLQTANTTTSNTFTFTSGYAVPNPGDFSGVQVSTGATVNLSNAVISYATHAVWGSSGTVTLNSVAISHTSSDAVNLNSTPLTMTGGSVSNAGVNGIYAQYANTTISGVVFSAVKQDAIYLYECCPTTPYTVAVTNNQIVNPGYAGLSLGYSTNPTVTGNVITGSGFAWGNGGSPVPAMYIYNSNLDLTSAVTNNTGSGNGFDALELGSDTATTSFTWITPTNSTTAHALGYLLQGNLVVNPGLVMTVPSGAVVKSSSGYIELNGSRLDGTAGGAVFTSMADNSVGIHACPSSIVSTCSPAAGDWYGIYGYSDNAGKAGNVALNGATLHWAGIYVNSGATSTAGDPTHGLSLNSVSIDHTNGNAIDSRGTPASINGGTVSAAAGNGVYSTYANLSINALTINSSSSYGIYAYECCPTTPYSVSITNSTISGAGYNGIFLQYARNPTVKNNIVNGAGSSGTRYTAVDLSNDTIDLASAVSGTSGGASAIDAIELDSDTVTTSFTWITPTDSPSSHALGYLINGNLTLNPALTLSLPAGSQIKVNYGYIELNGARLDGTAGGAVFTSMDDNSVGVPTCPSSIVSTCTPAAGHWYGLNAYSDGAGNHGNIALTGATLHWAGITINSGATSSAGDPTHGLSLSGVNIDNTNGDAINAYSTPAAIAGGTIQNPSGSGITVNYANAAISGVTVSGAGNSGIYVYGCCPSTPYTVAVDGNTVSNATNFGIDIQYTSNLDFQNNTVTGSGVTPMEPAVYLGSQGGAPVLINNTGSGNGTNMLAIDGSINSSLTWVAPGTAALAYNLSQGSSLTVNGAGHTLTMPPGSIVKATGGGLYLQNGASLSAGSGNGGGVTFTSARDDSNKTVMSTCGTWFNSYKAYAAPANCTPAVNDWHGIQETGGGSVTVTGSANSGSTIAYANDGIYASNYNNGLPSGNLNVSYTTISYASDRGIYSDWTPLSVTNSTLSNTYYYDGIWANVEHKAGATVSNNLFSGNAHVGMNLISASNPTVQNNTFNNNGPGYPNEGVKYPALLLEDLTLDSGTPAITGNTGSKNLGGDAMVIYGTIAVSGFQWQPYGGSNLWTTLGPDGWLYVSGSTTTLTIPAGSVLKTNNGLQVNNGASLTVGDPTGGGATFTSPRDDSTGLPSTCGSWLNPWRSYTAPANCTPSGNDWSGIETRSGASLTVNGNAVTVTRINYAWRGIDAQNYNNGSPSGNLNVNYASINSSWERGIYSDWTPISVTNSTLSSTVYYDGIWANVRHLATATISNDTFTGNGHVGMNLTSASNPTVQNNTFTNNGPGYPNEGIKYPALLLEDLTLDTGSPAISGNTGSGNQGGDAEVIYGTIAVSGFQWQPYGGTNLWTTLGPDGWLYVSGSTTTLTIPNKSVIKTNQGLQVQNGASLTIGDPTGGGATFTSPRDDSTGLPPTCGSWLNPYRGYTAPANCTPSAYDWSGIPTRGGASLTVNGNAVTMTKINYAWRGIDAQNYNNGQPSGNLSVNYASINSSWDRGINSDWTPISVTNSTLSNTVYYDGITANVRHLATATISNDAFTGNGHVGMNLTSASNPTVQNNTFTNNGSGYPNEGVKYPALLLEDLTLDSGRPAISANTGSGNQGGDAEVIYGTIAVSGFQWQPYGGSNLWTTLGPDGWLYVSGSTTTLTIPAGSVLKTNNGLQVNNGASLTVGDPTGGGATFTSPRDDSTGLPSTCGSWLNPWRGYTAPANCTPSGNDWSGIETRSGASLTVNGNAVTVTRINYGWRGIDAQNYNNGSPSGNLNVNYASINSSWERGIYSDWTPISVTNSTLSSTVYYDGIWANVRHLATATISNDTFTGNGHVGMNLTSASNPTVKNNTFTNNGPGYPNEGVKYPALLLEDLTLDSGTPAISGNTGSGNQGGDAEVIYGTIAVSGFTWQPLSGSNLWTTLGPNGDLTVSGSTTTLTIPFGSVVKTNRGLYVTNGASLTVGDPTGGGATFTSPRDDSTGLPSTCGSWLNPWRGYTAPANCTPAPNDWNGIQTRGGASLTVNGNAVTMTKINYAWRGIDAYNYNAGSPSGNLSVKYASINSASDHGILTDWTPISITNSTISNTYYYDGLNANLEHKSAATLTGNTFTGNARYGAIVLHADNPAVSNNSFTNNGPGYPNEGVAYPAFTLQDVNLTTSPSISGNSGSGNKGGDAFVIDGTIAVGGFQWMPYGGSALWTTLGPNGWLYVNGANTTLTIPSGSVSKGYYGLQALGGASVTVGDANGGATFTSPRDDSPGLPSTCGSSMNPWRPTCAPGPSDWPGFQSRSNSTLQITGTAASPTRINYATTAIDAENSSGIPGGTGSLSIGNTTFSKTWNQAIYATGVPVSITAGTVINGNGNSSNGAYFYTLPAGTVCALPCPTININGLKVTGTGGYGLRIDNGNVQVTCSNISGNTGGIDLERYSGDTASVSITNSTIANNWPASKAINTGPYDLYNNTSSGSTTASGDSWTTNPPRAGWEYYQNSGSLSVTGTANNGCAPLAPILRTPGLGAPIAPTPLPASSLGAVATAPMIAKPPPLPLAPPPPATPTPATSTPTPLVGKPPPPVKVPLPPATPPATKP